MRRWLALAWAAVCIFVAVTTSGNMLVSFVPSTTSTGQFASEETAGIERVRWYWARGVWLTSAMLIISVVTLVVCTWHPKRIKHG